MQQLLSQKKILLVGAGGLLGGKLVESLLAVDAQVIAADVKLEKLNEDLKKRGIDINTIEVREVDITNQFDVTNLFNVIGHIDGAINASYPRNSAYGAHLFDVSLESFNENVSLQLGSAFLFSQQCAAYFKRQNHAFSLVNISSIYGVITPKFQIYNDTLMTTPVEYAAIKSALLHLTKYIVAYVNDSRFRINCVSPGGILDDQPDAFLEAYKKQTHGSGMLDSKDIVGSVLFFLSEYSQFITGQNIIVDDGFSL